MNDKPKNTPPQPALSGVTWWQKFFNRKIGRIEYALWLGGSGVVCLAMFFFVMPLLHYLANLRFIVPIVLFSILSSLGAIWRLNFLGAQEKILKYVVVGMCFAFPTCFIAFFILFFALALSNTPQYHTVSAYSLFVGSGFLLSTLGAFAWPFMQIYLLVAKGKTDRQEIG